MSLKTLERIKVKKNNSPEILKTIKNGKLIVTNVPHLPYPNGYGPDGKQVYIPANVMYNLSKIFRDMLDNNYFEFDYRQF